MRATCSVLLTVCSLAAVFSLFECGNAQETAAARFTLTRELRIGAVDDREYSLTFVGGLAARTDGTILVLQPQDGTIKAFGANGKSRGAIGRKGSGPGEFVSPVVFGIKDDSVWVVDHGLARISLFAPDGAFVASYSFVNTGSGFRVVPVALLNDGSIAATIAVPTSVLTISRMPLLRMARSGAVVDTIVWLSVEKPLAFRDASSEYNGFFSVQPIRQEPLYQILRDGAGVAIVEWEAAPDPGNASITIRSVAINGDTTRTSRIPYKPRALQPAARDSLIDYWVGAVLRSRGAGIKSPADARHRVRGQLNSLNLMSPLS